MIDWKSLLDQYHIEYVEHGPSVTKGNICISCPYCGDSDPSHHLGINLSNGYYGCWRDERHRGRNPARLIQTLLKCSRLHAESIVRNGTQNLSNFDDIIKNLSQTIFEPEKRISKVVFPPNIKTLVDKGLGRKFIDYLVNREYTRIEAQQLCEIYNLMYATTGPFAFRVIVPIEMEDGVVTWTGRDITGTSDSRYKTLSKEESKQSIKECVFGYPSLIDDDSTSDTLIVCEGPFDAIRTDYFGYVLGIRATCLFGLQASDRQVGLLTKLSTRFRYKYLCLDAGATVLQLHLLDKLSFLDFKDLRLPEGYKDPGSLPKEILLNWLRKVREMNAETLAN